MYANTGGSRSWILQARAGGARRDMGLAGYPDVTLAPARESARAARRQQMRLGLDLIEKGKAMRSAPIASRAAAITFPTLIRQKHDGRHRLESESYRMLPECPSLSLHGTNLYPRHCPMRLATLPKMLRFGAASLIVPEVASWTFSTISA